MTTTNSTIPSLPLSAQDYPRSAAWNKCVGMHTENQYLDSMLHPRADPYWPPPKGLAVDTVFMFAMECSRMAWGPFERPVRMIIEAHDANGPPAACLPPSNPNGVTFFRTVNSLWVNDTQVADWLRKTYDGLNVLYSPIDFNQSLQTPPFKQVWTWGTDHQSQLTLLDEGGFGSVDPTLQRIYWYNATRVGYMDFDGEGKDHDGLVERPIRGTLSPPMMGAAVSKDYESTGVWLHELTATGIIQQFKDHQCKEPA